MRSAWPILALSALLFLGCRRVSFTDSASLPPIFPDYAGVTIPEGMAALTFKMADGRPFKVEEKRVGDTLFYYVKAWNRKTGEGVSYAPFPVYVSKDPIDPFIAYRLIEPNYESWREVGLYARELSSYKEKPIVTNQATGGGCVNCHTFSPADPDRMLFHARGAGGGTVFLDHGNARILNLATVGPRRQGTYPAWHPEGRYVAFSSNSTFQSFPVSGSQQVEVYDTASDLILMDTQTDSVTVWPSVSGTAAMETFPAWSQDGHTLYFCQADSVKDVVSQRSSIHYALMSVSFNDGQLAEEPVTVWESDSVSLSFPRVNGRWMLLTASAYGTFPIWHPEADLWLLDMETGQMQVAEALCSQDTESYHSWSSNGRWVVFSSRREDGRYTRLYLSHFDGEGHFSKPFLLPQKDPSYNVWRLKSYNVPEFVRKDPGSHNSAVSRLFRRP